MNVLDENIVEAQRKMLEAARVRFRQVGVDVARSGTSDENVIPVLHRLRSVTFFTRDQDYFLRRLCLSRYCLVYLNVDEKETADYIRQFLRHPRFRTWAQRQGKVIRVQPLTIRVYQLNVQRAQDLPW